MLSSNPYNQRLPVASQPGRPGLKARTRKVIIPIIALLALSGLVTNPSTGHRLLSEVRNLCQFAVYFPYDDTEEPIGVWTEAYKASRVNYFDRALEASPFRDAKSGDLAFVVPMLDCPELQQPGVSEDAPPSELFYDAAAMIKSCLCGEGNEVILGGVSYNVTLYVHMPADAAECMGPNGAPYDRVKVLEELGFIVTLVGPPVGKAEIESPYVRDFVEKDVGLRDLIKLRAFEMTTHPLVVVASYHTMVLKPIDYLLNTVYEGTAPIAYAKDYAPLDATPSSTNTPIDTGFMIVKPDQQEFVNILNAYKTTDFSPATGWDGSGVGGFPGELGTAGILTHYYSTKAPTDPAPVVLDKCAYNNDLDVPRNNANQCRNGQATCDDCKDTPLEDISVARLTDTACAEPFTCPDTTKVPVLCKNYLETWFSKRVTFEEEHLEGGRRSPRDGPFQTEVYQGYCQAEGVDGYDKIIVDAESGPLPEEEPDIPATQEPGCTLTCPPGQYLTLDCTCSTDECEACPEGTRCQKAGNGYPALCIDCECGFCDYDDNPCCNFNGVNNCKSATNRKECKMQNGYYPGWAGTGNACSGVEISATATPNGCGCQPNELTMCTYDPSIRDEEDKCFIVRAHELLASEQTAMDAEETNTSNQCRECLEACDMCVSEEGQEDVHAMQKCLGSTIGKKRSECRTGCSTSCKHATVA